jgi:hypothetical protein
MTQTLYAHMNKIKIKKIPNVQNKERILKVAREKHQVIYKDKPIRIIADISEETL